MTPTPQPLHELIYLNLRESILGGDIGLGDRLVESQLAEQMQVSRTPIREAIRRLQQEGLLTVDSANGVTPVEISLDNAIHLYDCRTALEILAVESACRSATPEQIDALRGMARRADALLEAQGGPASAPEVNAFTLEQLDLNYGFHQLIAESSQNPWLVSLLDQLANQVKLLRLQILGTPVDVAAIQSEHWQIVEAIAQRDVAAAAAQMRRHLEVSKARVTKTLHQQSQIMRREAAAAQLSCPRCGSQQLRKNGRRKQRQNYLCRDCGRQFLG